MYLKSVPKVDSIDEIVEIERRLSKAYFAGKLEKELKKIQKEKNFKNPIYYKVEDWIENKEKYDEYNKDRKSGHDTKVSIDKEVGYWRKFNALHSWFVNTFQDGVDECQQSIVDPEVLKELLYKLATINKKNVKDVLPTQKGFFFGGTDYDEYFWQDVEEFRIYLLNLLADNDFEEITLIYRASW